MLESLALPFLISFSQDHILDLYKNDEYLKNRVSIYQYTQSKENIWDWAWNLFPITKATNILEVGSGLGSYWQINGKKLPQGCKLTLTDLSPAMVKATEKNNPDLDNYAEVSYKTANVENLPFTENSFDKIFCHFVLFYTQEPEKAINELKRVVKPGGVISILTLNSEYCKPLYEFAHKVDSRFPNKDRATEQFDECKADEQLKNFFSKIDKYVYEAKIKFYENSDLKPFLKSVAQGYQIPINQIIENEFQKEVDHYIKLNGSLSCTSRSALYICYL